MLVLSLFLSNIISLLFYVLSLFDLFLFCSNLLSVSLSFLVLLSFCFGYVFCFRFLVVLVYTVFCYFLLSSINGLDLLIFSACSFDISFLFWLLSAAQITNNVSWTTIKPSAILVGHGREYEIIEANLYDQI